MIPLSESIKYAVAPLKVSANDKNQSIELALNSEGYYFHDKKWIAEGLSNIIKNAIEHTSIDGEIKIILEETKLESFIKNADFVITGEGRLDGQTVMGKAPIGVAEIAKKYEKKVLAFGGCVAEDATLCNQHGIDAFFPILRTVTTLKEAMDFNHAKENLSAAVEQVFRLIQSFE